MSRLCEISNCKNKWTFKAIPPVEGASTLYLCEFHMPKFRDKDYKLIHISARPK